MRSQVAIPKIINGNVPGPTAQTTNCSFEVVDNKCICGVIVTASVTVLATGAATKSVPTVPQAFSESRFVIGSTNQRRRSSATAFGGQGLNALNEAKNAGLVQYFQAGVAITAAVNSITCGALPVVLGSAEDIAIQAALANNTTTVSVFRLPFLFAEDFRKDVPYVEAMALPIAYGANGQVTGNIGKVFFQFDIPPIPNTAGNPSLVSIVASEIYDERLLAAGSGMPNLMKEKIYQDTYTVGDVELADQFTNTDSIQRVSFLTISDQITKFVVKQGERVIRSCTYEENLTHLATAGFNIRAIPRNRLDIEFDINDDPTGALPIVPNAKLSIVCTFATINDAAKQVFILPSFYGKVE